jgi:hypothetical protein
MALSEAAKQALINVGTNRQGARVEGNFSALAELFRAGLIGHEDGLTRKGTIERERLQAAALDAAFG